MATPLLSIVVVNWNTRDALRTCLRSVGAHTACEHEIIVVDNAGHLVAHAPPGGAAHIDGGSSGPRRDERARWRGSEADAMLHGRAPRRRIDQARTP
jgi:hypothetical protein